MFRSIYQTKLPYKYQLTSRSIDPTWWNFRLKFCHFLLQSIHISLCFRDFISKFHNLPTALNHLFHQTVHTLQHGTECSGNSTIDDQIGVRIAIGMSRDRLAIIFQILKGFSCKNQYKSTSLNWTGLLVVNNQKSGEFVLIWSLQHNLGSARYFPSCYSIYSHNLKKFKSTLFECI